MSAHENFKPDPIPDMTLPERTDRPIEPQKIPDMTLPERAEPERRVEKAPPVWDRRTGSGAMESGGSGARAVGADVSLRGENPGDRQDQGADPVRRRRRGLGLRRADSRAGGSPGSKRLQPPQDGGACFLPARSPKSAAKKCTCISWAAARNGPASPPCVFRPRMRTLAGRSRSSSRRTSFSSDCARAIASRRAVGGRLLFRRRHRRHSRRRSPHPFR